MIEGNFFRSGESTRYTAQLHYINRELIIYGLSNNTKLQNSVLEDVTITNRLGNTPRHIQFKNGDRFETNDNDAIDQITKQSNRHGSQLLHWLENHYGIIAIMLITTVLITWSVIQYGVPAAAKWAAYRMPASWYAESGTTTLKYMDESILKPSHLKASRQQQLKAYFLNSIPDIEDAGQIKVGFRDSKLMGANAFALPSGDIIFTDDLVNLSCDDRELLAIFHHEVGHIEQRHMARRVLQSSMIAVATAITFGDSSSMGELIVALPTFLLEMGYSRDFEREADDFAYHTMQTQNIELGYFSSILNRIESQYNEAQNNESGEEIKNYFLTHPSTVERSKRFGNDIQLSCEK